MKNRRKLPQIKKYNYKKIIPLLMVVATLFMCVGYASINSITLQLAGTTYANSPVDVFIQDALITSSNEADLNNSNILLYSGTMLNSKVALSTTNIDSTLTMTVTIYNTTKEDYIFTGVTYGDNFYTDDEENLNTSIDYQVVNTTNETNKINSGKSLILTLTFKYSDEYKESLPTQPYQNILNSYLKFNFIEIPTLELSNEGEIYKTNMYPGYIKEYEFTISNYNDIEVNSVPMIYSFETTIDTPLTVEIYDEAGNEVVDNISIDGDDKTKTKHTYTMKLIWDNQSEEFNYSEYQDKEFKSNIVLKAVPDSEISVEYSIIKEFNVEIKVAPFYFNVNADTNINMEKETATLPITITNYNSETEYNEFETKYQIIIEGNEKFEITVDDQSLSNYTMEKTLSGGSKIDDSFNINFNADINTLDLTENIILRIIPKTPYIDEEINLSITISLQPVTITFDASGGTVSPATKTVYKWKTYEELPTPIWYGHTFNGWYTKADGGGTKVESTTEVTTSNKTQTIYAKWTSYLLADTVEIGDYVDYEYVYYTNVGTNSSGQYIPQDSYVNWRVLSADDEDGDGINEVRLITAGVPMTYVFTRKSTETAIKTEVNNITTNFFSTGFTSTSTTSKFYRNGFYKLLDDGTKQSITTIGALQTAFTNNYTQTNSSGVPMVQSITKEDVDELVGVTTTDGDDLTGDGDLPGYNYLLAIPAKDQSGKYASYYVAGYSYYSSYTEPYHLWNSYYSGGIVGTQAEHGIRPVVTLKETVINAGGSGTASAPYLLTVE